MQIEDVEAWKLAAAKAMARRSKMTVEEVLEQFSFRLLDGDNVRVRSTTGSSLDGTYIYSPMTGKFRIKK